MAQHLLGKLIFDKDSLVHQLIQPCDAPERLRKVYTSPAYATTPPPFSFSVPTPTTVQDLDPGTEFAIFYRDGLVPILVSVGVMLGTSAVCKHLNIFLG